MVKTLDGLTALIRKLAERKLGKDETDALVREVSADIEERRDEAIGRGIDSVEAERLAVESFGDPEPMVSELLKVKRGQERLFPVKIAIVACFAGSLMLFSSDGTRELVQAAGLSFAAGVLAVAITSFRSRRPQPLAIALTAGLWVVLAVGMLSTLWVNLEPGSTSRSRVNRWLTGLAAKERLLRSQERFAREGVQDMETGRLSEKLAQKEELEIPVFVNTIGGKRGYSLGISRTDDLETAKEAWILAKKRRLASVLHADADALAVEQKTIRSSLNNASIFRWFPSRTFFMTVAMAMIQFLVVAAINRVGVHLGRTWSGRKRIAQ
ncbi:hypothetical protein EON81_06725 [bacterium]|nr:MAG: hypothetical protein EON81_06725 [bacterium]